MGRTAQRSIMAAVMTLSSFGLPGAAHGEARCDSSLYPLLQEQPAILRSWAPQAKTYALVIAALPLTVGKSAKIVWQVPTTGSFRVVARQMGRSPVEPAWGPTRHGASTFDPTRRTPAPSLALPTGAEYGTGWVFPKAGCWRFEVTFGGRRAQLGVRVLD